jgi:hypothetical protein
VRHVQKWPRPIATDNSRTNGRVDWRLFASLDWSTAGTNENGVLTVRSPVGHVKITPEPKLRGKVEPVKLPEGKWAWQKIQKDSGS